MIFLDTDHITVLRYPESSRHLRLKSRLQQHWDEGIALTVVTVEEQMRGWLARIHKAKTPDQQVEPYEALTKMVSFLCRWQIEPFDTFAIVEFKKLKQQRVKIGTQDLKIASIALANNALLLSANLKDFEKVPGLRVENWMD